MDGCCYHVLDNYMQSEEGLEAETANRTLHFLSSVVARFRKKCPGSFLEVVAPKGKLI